jgi:hypothetical protein
MKSRLVEITQVIDHGTVVVLAGHIVDDKRPIRIVCDHRPFAVFWHAWSAAEFPQPVVYDPNAHTLRFD